MKKTVIILLASCLVLLSACHGGSSEITVPPTGEDVSASQTENCKHEIVTDPLVPATCLDSGLSEGSHCEICGEIILAQENIVPSGHCYRQWSEPEMDSSGQWFRFRSCEVCGEEQSEPTEPIEPVETEKDLGSAGKLTDRTLLVAIFADEAGCSWDFNNAEDASTAELMRRHLGAGVQWLSQQCGTYGVTPEFIYEWEEYKDLYYTHDFGQETLVRTDGQGYWSQESYIDQHIPTEELKEKYQAENVIYIFYFNTDQTNTVNSWSIGNNQGMHTEIINVFVRDDYSGGFYYMPASSFAHEIMHCFGAQDLYYATDMITQEYVDHCAATGSNDIMYTVSLGDTITQELSLLDAYYMGLTEVCALVEQWGLGESAHFS